MTEKEKFPNETMFTHIFGYALQESVVKIEFGPVGNPICRQTWRKVPKNWDFFFFDNFFSSQKSIGP